MEDTRHPIDIVGIRFTPMSEPELHGFIGDAIRERKTRIILSGNVHALNLASEEPWLRDFFNQADAVRIDGFGLRLGARLLREHLPRRMTWADFIWTLGAAASACEWSLYLLGARPGVAEEAASRLRQRFSLLHIAGTAHGYFDQAVEGAENRRVVADINAAHPDILIVGMGMPRQERWLLENRAALNVPVILTGGAVFDYAAGTLRRPPRWMTDHGLEWLGRMLIEPRRLWKRYVVGNPKFLARVLRQRLSRQL